MEAVSNWKSKFTQKQLDRKRLVDRVGQKRTRQQQKRNFAQLEARLNLLLQGEQSALMRNLIEENDNMRKRLDCYETKFETIMLCTKECLDMSLGDDSESNAVSLNPNEQKDSSASPNTTSVSSISKNSASDDRVCKRYVFDPSLPFLSSTIFSGGIPHPSQERPRQLEVSPEEVIEQVASWKLTNNHRVGFEFLIKACALDRGPTYLTAASIRQRIQSTTFYRKILHQLVPHDTVDPPPSTDGEGSSNEVLSEMNYQMRAVGLCACEIVGRWRSLFKSPLECISIFWALEKLFMFLAFPSCENLMRTPPWIWPSKLQLSQEHPGFIDCLQWPSLRDELIFSWHQYNVKALSVQLTRFFELRNTGWTSIALPLRLKPDHSGLSLDATFEAFIFDSSNLLIRSEFFSQYPGLMSCMASSHSTTQLRDSSGASDGQAIHFFQGQEIGLTQRLQLTPMSYSSLQGRVPLTLSSPQTDGSLQRLPDSEDQAAGGERNFLHEAEPSTQNTNSRTEDTEPMLDSQDFTEFDFLNMFNFNFPMTGTVGDYDCSYGSLAQTNANFTFDSTLRDY